MPKPTPAHAMPSMFTLRSTIPLVLLLGVTVALGGCKDLTGNPGLPAGTPNPTFYNTAAGAVGMRNAAISQLQFAIKQYITDSGLLTDELQDASIDASQGLSLLNGTTVQDPLDERILPVGVTVDSYSALQGVREASLQALGALATYDTAAATRDSAATLRGELYAVEGYAEIMLADLFCSGVPLSTLDFQKDFNYAPSSSTTQVYQAAIAKFDTALVLASASDSVMNLARVGQGRAYLDLGKYAAAADDVEAVPDGFQYSYWTGFVFDSNGGIEGYNVGFIVSDAEGTNGLPFISSDDPRTAVDTIGTVNSQGNPVLVPYTFPTKYIWQGTSSGVGGDAPFTLASGVEARLIQAEAALNAGDATTWLTLLNQLRTTVPGLSPISDPVDPTARIDTMFTERAAWLFLDGHRQGDLRRLLRQYSQYGAFQDQSDVYPTGQYLGNGTGVYGQDVTAPIPLTEEANPLFHGCLNRNP